MRLFVCTRADKREKFESALKRPTNGTNGSAVRLKCTHLMEREKRFKVGFPLSIFSTLDLDLPRVCEAG